MDSSPSASVEAKDSDELGCRFPTTSYLVLENFSKEELINTYSSYLYVRTTRNTSSDEVDCLDSPEQDPCLARISCGEAPYASRLRVRHPAARTIRVESRGIFVQLRDTEHEISLGVYN
jgi:predicted AAA+ superfamily ATPase